MNKVIVVGAKGNMGRRYCSILKYLGVEHVGVDIDTDGNEIDYSRITHVILATPTASHIDDIHVTATYGVPILCEKPISTNIAEVYSLCTWAEENGVLLRMVNQYKYLLNYDYMAMPSPDRHTSWDYFNSGKDGLLWDCISVIALAEESIEIKNTSPFWECMINGYRFRSSAMDAAYVSMVKNFIGTPMLAPETEYIRKSHARVQKILDGGNGEMPLAFRHIPGVDLEKFTL